MACYDSTVRNSLRETSCNSSMVKTTWTRASPKSNLSGRSFFNDREFEHRYRVDATDPKGGFLPGVLQVSVDDSSLELQRKLDEEYEQLVEDRRILRNYTFKGCDKSTRQSLPVNLYRIVQNATQNFHIDRRKPSDLEPVYVIEQVQQLVNRLVAVRGSDYLSKEASDNATLAFPHAPASGLCRPTRARGSSFNEGGFLRLGYRGIPSQGEGAGPTQTCSTHCWRLLRLRRTYEPKVYFVVRIRGINKIASEPRKSFQLLRLLQNQQWCFGRVTKATQQTLRLVDPYVIYE